MKKTLFIIVLLIFSFTSFPQGVEFVHRPFDEVLAKAEKENKLVFMDCYTEWCGPCKRLSKETFPLKEVGDFFNTHFINIKMDMEKGEGIELKKRYDVNFFPTLLWLDAEGNILYKSIGYRDMESLIDQAKIAVDPAKNWVAMNKKFKDGERSIEFLREYILTASEMDFDPQQAKEIYFYKRNNDELFSEKEFQVIQASVKSVLDAEYKIVFKNKEKFYDIAGKEKVDNYIIFTANHSLFVAKKSGNESEIEKVEHMLMELDKNFAIRTIEEVELGILLSDPDRNKYYNAGSDLMIKYHFDHYETLNGWLSEIFRENEVELNEEVLKKVLKIARRSVELHEDYFTTDTYAQALYRSGRTDEAMKMAKKSLKLAPETIKQELWSLRYFEGEL